MVSLMSSSGGLPSITLQEMLDNAARLVDKHMQEDQNYLDLSDLLKTPSTNQPSVSGLNDVDYPCLLDTHLGLDSLTEVSDSKLVPLPPELVEQYSRMQCNCTMGMFPEIGRAWLTIDSDIFVWRFEDGSDLAYFDGLSETILSVALVKPKQGIFQAHIQYLLCLATPVDIVLLAVSFSKPHDDTGSGSQSEMHLLPDPLFSIPTDNTYIMSIIGTANGRIFMAGKDGCLYELVYQADDGWFSRKCRKVNHSTSSLSFLVPSFLNFSFSEDDPLLQLNIDESRHILYARSEKGTIQVFDLGKDGKGMGKVASVPLQTIVQNAAHIARTIERSNFKPIVHISAVTQSESANINLVAVTQSGVRLYFSTGSFNSPKSRPSTLTLVHVRLPPGFTASAMVHKPTQVHTAFHKQGTLMLISSQTDDSDLIWVVSCDSFPFQNQLMEAQMCKPLNGRTWSVCEVAPKTLDAGQQLRGSDTSRPNPPAVVTQHAEMPRKFILLTTQGCHIMNKLRPVDQLRQLLIDCQGPDSDEVKGFFKLHKIEQACATCLILATSKFASDQAVSSWATMAFFNNGGEPQYTFGGTGLGMDKHLMPSNIGPGGLHPSQTSTPAAGVGHSYYHPSMPPNPNMGHDVMFSGKHNGICLYLSRILRSVWDMNVVSDVPCNTSQGIVHYITCTFPTEELNQLLENIRGLSDFMDFNSRYNSGPSDGGLPPLPLTPHVMGGWMGMDDQMKKKLQGDAQKIEDISLQNLQELIHRVEEVLGLLKVLVDHQFHVIIGSLNQDIQSQLLSMSFKQLIVSGKDLCNSLITCLINRYLQDNATIDSINKCLRETCPSLYSVDDATCSKANELLQAARINQNKHERRQQLNEALKLYKDVTNPLQLPVVCSQFANVNFYDGIVDLCLTLASKRDPQQLALHYYQRGEQIDDIQGQMAYVQRMECYNCITDMLGYLLSSTGSHPNLSQGQQTELNILNAADVEQYKSEVFRLVLKSEDELFHVALYDWLFKEQLTEKLLEIQSPFIEPYLKRRAGYQPDSVSALDMLWKYYEKNRHFPAAAKILSRLAEKHGTDVNLQQRMEYLSRAIMCAKSSTSRSSSATEGEFLHELEEKMEVARLQLQVQKSISRLRGNPMQIQEGVSRLDCDLMDLTTLYEEFADKFGLQESKLAIVHCAGLSDGALVESLWQGIIEKELNSTVNMTQQLKITNLKTKLIPLGKQYINTERYFPKVFLVRIMEQKSCLLDFPASCVFEMMLEIGVSPIKLMEIYDRMFKSRDPFWQTIQKPLHLLDVLCELLSHLAKSMNTVPPYERRHFITMCLDCMAAYLVELQAMRINDHQRRLISSFKRLQAELERL